MTVVIGSTPTNSLNSSHVPLPFMETPHIHLIICCIFVFLQYTHSVCWWRLAISAGRFSSACQYQSNLRKRTGGKFSDEAHIYNSHFRLWLSKAVITWSQVPEIHQMVPGVNKWKGHRRWPLMELYFWPLKCVGVEDLMGSGVPTI